MPGRVDFSFEGGAPAQSLMIDDGGRDVFVVPSDRVWTPSRHPTASIVTFSPALGYWPMSIAADELADPRQRTVHFPRIAPSGPLGWWHRVVGIRHPGRPRGAGIRIGIIDEALPSQPHDSCIAHVQNLGGLPAGRRSARQPFSHHAEQICAILGARPRSECGAYEGIAPDSEFLFAAAGSDGAPKLATARVASSIQYLAEQERCDLISISAGDVDHEIEVVRNAVGIAEDHGTLCFFSAGNSYRPGYPAQYDECVAVSSLGQRGQAPAASQIAWMDANEARSIDADPLYLWERSARGPVVDFSAPGVGIVWSRASDPAGVVFGTSFACPIAVGVAAIRLSNDAAYRAAQRDVRRSARARTLLTADGAYEPYGAPQRHNYWKYGLLRVT